MTVPVTVTNSGGRQMLALTGNGARAGGTALISPRNSGLPFAAYFLALGVHLDSQVRMIFCNNTGSILNLHNFDLHIMTFR